MNFRVHLVDYLSFMIPGVIYLSDLSWIVISLSKDPERYYQYILKFDISHFLLILLFAFITARILNPVFAPILKIFIKGQKIMNDAFKEIENIYPMLNFHANIKSMDMLFYSGKFADKGDFDPMVLCSADFLLYQNISISILILTIYELFYFFYSGYIYKHLIIFFVLSYIFMAMVRATKSQLNKYYISFYSKVISYIIEPEIIVGLKKDENERI